MGCFSNLVQSSNFFVGLQKFKKAMIVCKSLSELESALVPFRSGNDIGFVPTMGALHNGHISLVKTSKEKASITVVSIFVNPTQFNNPDDLARYPRTEDADCRLLGDAGADVVFIPTYEDIYPIEDNRLFDLGGLDLTGEGPRRPGHFNGVAKVVSRLFDIVRPRYAFFGEKDFQQLAIIRYITKQLGYPIEIIGCPTLRESDGLAMSSRNMLLSKEHRAVAPFIYEVLFKTSLLRDDYTIDELQRSIVGQINSEPLLKVEYVEIVDAETLRPVKNWTDAANIQLCTAVYAGEIRLIDNIKLK